MWDADPTGFRESAIVEEGRPPRRKGGTQIGEMASARGFNHRRRSVAHSDGRQVEGQNFVGHARKPLPNTNLSEYGR